jgi:hypothetical protein
VTKEEKDSLFQKNLKHIKGKVGGDLNLGDAYIASLKFEPERAKAIRPDLSNLESVFIAYVVQTSRNMRRDEFKTTFFGKEHRHCKDNDEVKSRRFKKQYRPIGIATNGGQREVETRDLAEFITEATKESSPKIREIVKTFYIPLLLGEVPSIDDMGDVVSDTDKKAAKKAMAEILTGVI